MDYVTNKKEAEEKLQRLQHGYCAYVDSKEVANILKKQIKQFNLNIHEEETERGYWFTPDNVESMESNASGDVVIIN